MRQLRAWDKENKRWVYSGRTPSMMHSFWKWVMYDVNTIVNEETGLKDKNGKEIYEGDIVEWDAIAIGERQKVRFQNGSFVLDAHPLFIHLPNIKIVGNIYDNPELLENGDKNRE